MTFPDGPVTTISVPASRERCHTSCRDVPRISRWLAGAIKLQFRKLNSILCERVGRAAGTSIGAREDARLGTPGHRLIYGGQFCCSALSLLRLTLLQADNLRRAARIAANGKPEAMQVDDRSHQAQA